MGPTWIGFASMYYKIYIYIYYIYIYIRGEVFRVLSYCFRHTDLYRMAHEKPARRFVDQRGRRSRTLYRKLNKCKCKVLTG